MFKSAIKSIKKNKEVSDIATHVGFSFAQSGISFAKRFLNKPGIHAYLEYQVEKIVYGWSESGPQPEIASVARIADAIVGHFKSEQIYPNRIAVDGVPGSGKSTLSRAIGERLKMDVICLDHQNLNKKIDFDQDGAIYEHHRLLRTQDLDAFDAIIYIDEPVSISIDKVLQRKRGGYLVEILNYDTLKQIGEKAFDAAAGESIPVLNQFIKIKLKPEEGFNDLAYIQRELFRKGLDGTGYSKEEQLFLCLEGKARRGFSAYLNLQEYKEELISGLKSELKSGLKTGIKSALFQAKPDKRG